MQYRRLGNSDLEVSEIALGSWLTYGGGIDTKTSVACIQKAFESGINFIDTANVYASGGAESFLGETLKPYRREDYVLATKLYFPMSDTDSGLSAAQVHKQIDASLARLKTDYVDLYQCHRYDEDTPLEETMQALTEVVAAGKARYVGFSEWNASQITAASSMDQYVAFVSSQPQYSMLWREPEEQVFPVCEARQIGQIVWSPLAQGVLTGKYRPGKALPADSRAANPSMNQFMGRASNQDLLLAVEELGKVAKELGITLAQLALAWVLRHDNVAAAIIGASRPEQIAENVRASGIVLDEQTLQQIDQIIPPSLRL